MNAIIPLNIAALRVNRNDQSSVVRNFKGRVAAFEKIPTQAGEGASTGDTVVNLLLDQTGPANPLGPGIHLHWELPDYFRKGLQDTEGGNIVFPQVPNRWLVTRYMRYRMETNSEWIDVAPQQWVVESDFISPDLQPEADGTRRPAVPVPVPTRESKPRPWQYMGRVVEARAWKPNNDPQQYLPSYAGPDGKPLHLTSIGFLGPGFSAYYPDCSSVFGFWDRFADVEKVYDAIQNNLAHELRVSYAVMGWVDAPGGDPFDSVEVWVRKNYDDYARRCNENGVAPEQTPLDFFVDYARTRWGWEFHQKPFTFSLQEDHTLKEIHLPQKSICAGKMQEIGWDMLQNPGSTAFLNSMPDSVRPGIGQDLVKLAVGNTPLEALSVLAATNTGTREAQDQMEILMNALQLGLLDNLEQHPDAISMLEEGLHSSAFSRKQGGKWWMIRRREGRNLDKGEPVTLPIELAKKLDAVNEAQKRYDAARAQLFQMRQQLFVDWYRYIKMITGIDNNSLVSPQTLGTFLSSSSTGEIAIVVKAAREAGLLSYIQDSQTGAVIDIGKPADELTVAYKVWEAFRVLQEEIANYPAWGLSASSAAPFWNPSEPTLLMEGKRLEPARRNGISNLITVRLSQELIDRIDFVHEGKAFAVNATALDGLPVPGENLPLREDLGKLFGEFALLTPQFSPQIANALKKMGMPAAQDIARCIQGIQQLQGGAFPWEEAQTGGLFGSVRKLGYKASANPKVSASQPIVWEATFTNATQEGFAPNFIGWNAQKGLAEFAANRRDPYLPVSLVWGTSFESLKRTKDNGFADDVVTSSFRLDQDAVDLHYLLKGDGPAFATNQPVNYKLAIELSQKPSFSLTAQIDSYLRNHPQTLSRKALEALKQKFVDRNIMAQAMNGFSMMQELGLPIAQIPVQNLTMTSLRDKITPKVHNAAIANPQDNWYQTGFNGKAPISTEIAAQVNFGPLRAGFLQVKEMEVVDVFGQRFQLLTEKRLPNGSLDARAARSMRPAPGDKANANKIYLPPRVLAPVRTWFRWLSASYDNAPKLKLTGKQPDSAIPTTSPICGWLVPNHLEDRLAFFDADGSPIGSFGVENQVLRYRTRAGNLSNPTDDLELDLVENGKPVVNPHTATFLRYIAQQTPAFFADFSISLLESDAHIQPPNFQDEVSLSVLVGRPLAISRAMFNLESEGELLPVSQASTQKTDPWPEDINSSDETRRDLRVRQQYSDGNLHNVHFPVKLGDMSNSADGLVAFLPESKQGERYDLLFSAYAPRGRSSKVKLPESDTVTSTLNGDVAFFTMIHDPRAAVHVTTGILPVEELSIPSQQYSDALQNLQVTFTTWPVLRQQNQFVVPLPIEKGFAWSWVSPGQPVDLGLAENASNGNTTWGYSPQTAVEGWLKLSKAPVDTEKNKP